MGETGFTSSRGWRVTGNLEVPPEFRQPFTAPARSKGLEEEERLCCGRGPFPPDTMPWPGALA